MKERDDMYFPYLRGRQFELIALRELVEKDVLSSSDNAYYSIDTTITRIKKVLLEIKDNTAE